MVHVHLVFQHHMCIESVHVSTYETVMVTPFIYFFAFLNEPRILFSRSFGVQKKKLRYCSGYDYYNIMGQVISILVTKYALPNKKGEK